jgi:hypothetical protein
MVFAGLGGALVAFPLGFYAGAYAGVGYNAAKVSVASVRLRAKVPRHVPEQFQPLRQDTLRQIRRLRTDLTPQLGAVNNARWGQVTTNIELLRMAARELG